MTYYQKRKDEFFITPDSAIDIRTQLPIGNYVVQYNELANEFSLKQANAFTLPDRCYGDVQSRTSKVLNTFSHRSGTTGILLSGEKGSGKSLLAKSIAIQSKLPVLIINNPFFGTTFNQFISCIDQEFIMMFDEFEKVYDDTAYQQGLLTLLDGMSDTKKLVIMTCNREYAISDFLLNRPNRVYYHFRYNGVSEDFIREYCADNAPHLANDIVRLMPILECINFDVLQSIVAECIRYDESPSEVCTQLNVSMKSQDLRYEVTTAINSDGSILSDLIGRVRVIDVFTDTFSFYMGENEDQELVFSPKDITRLTSNTILYKNDECFVVELTRIVGISASFDAFKHLI